MLANAYRLCHAISRAADAAVMLILNTPCFACRHHYAASAAVRRSEPAVDAMILH